MIKKMRRVAKEAREDREGTFLMAQELFILMVIGLGPFVLFWQISRQLHLPFIVDMVVIGWASKKLQQGVDRRLADADELIKLRADLDAAG